jgi:ADP-heptose:LPS heptosyltransferase
MKLGYTLRKIEIRLIGFIRNLRESYIYLTNYRIENSFKRGDATKIKGLLILHNGALGDTYNFIGVVNRIIEKYPEIKVYCITREKNKSWWKNKKIQLIDDMKAEKLISGGEINAVALYGDTDSFIDKRRLFEVPYRAGRPFPYKTRKVTNEVIPIFKKLGFEIDKPSFYFTKEGEKTAKEFYNENKLNKTALIQVGSGKTIRALKEGLVPSHLWNPNNWAIVADYIIEYCKRDVIFTGVKEEKQMVKDVIKRMKNKTNFLDISGEYSIEEVVSIANKSDFAVGIDSGIIQIISQIGIPVIILFAGDPKISAPHSNYIAIWNSKVCSGCRKYYCPEGEAHCIEKISLADVLQKLPLK